MTSSVIGCGLTGVLAEVWMLQKHLPRAAAPAAVVVRVGYVTVVLNAEPGFVAECYHLMMGRGRDRYVNVKCIP